MSTQTIHVIGPGEVGTRLGEALRRAGREVAYVGRRDSAAWREAVEAASAPKILAMREDDLPGALDRFPEAHHDSLILVQNGFLEAVLGELPNVGRGLVWFTSKGDFFRELRPSLFHAGRGGGETAAITASLAEGGLAVEVLEDEEAFKREMILKGIWNCVVGLPLAVHEVDLGTYLGEQRDEIETLCDESARAASAWYGVEVAGRDAVARLDETTGELGWVTGGAKALAWRNGAVAVMGRARGVETPVNDRLLEAVGWDPDAAPGPAQP